MFLLVLRLFQQLWAEYTLCATFSYFSFLEFALVPWSGPVGLGPVGAGFLVWSCTEFKTQSQEFAARAWVCLFPVCVCVPDDV